MSKNKETKQIAKIKKSVQKQPATLNLLKKRLPFPVAFSLLILAAFLAASFFLPRIKQVHSATASDASESSQINFQKIATSSAWQATASPSATPVVYNLPQNYGRVVNVPIIYYHYIGKNPNPSDKLRDNLSVDPDVFDAQMEYISKGGYTAITFDTLYAALKGQTTLPPKPIIITFDDGYVDFYVNAFPILRKYNLHATQFIPTGLVDHSYYLHWEQIKEMDATGLISFEAHSISHANLPTLSDDEMRNQIINSKKILEQELGKPVNFMAYPYGTSNARVWEAVKEAGYFGAAGTWGSNSESEGNLYDLPRIKIPGGLSLEEFKRKI